MNLSHVAFEVKDMDRSVAFYCGALGFRDAFDLPDENGNPYIKYLKICDGQFLELFYHGSGQPSEGSYSHLCLETEDIFALAERLKKHNVPFDKEIIQSQRTKNYQFWIHDPDGNRIEFLQLDPESPQKKA